MGRMYLIFELYATDKVIVGAGNDPDKLLDIMMNHSEKRPCEMVEMVFNAETCKAEQHTIAEAGDLGEFMKLDIVKQRAGES